ncbi:MAG: translation initiation factor IF-2 [Deltaproteobacteria bacterium]|nr:translation initiation factor IF-2 [Deltaproteobacteria bacterium]
MAKQRVYEVARKLNMENSDLLDKLQTMGIDVSSHANSIDDDVVERVREELFGKPAPAEVVEETRVKSTVIRRRRKPRAKPDTDAALPAETATEETPDKTDETVKKAGSEKEADETAKETALKSAKTAEAAPVEDSIEVAGEEEKDGQEAPDIEQETEHEVEIQPPPVKKAKKSKKALADTDKSPETADDEKPAAPVKKRKKKGTAAKIISLPEKPVEPIKPVKTRKPVKARKPATPGPARYPKTAPAAPVQPAAPPVFDRKKGKKKKGGVPAVEENETLKKGVKKRSFRRKEIVEGNALYDRKGRSRKGRKKSKATKHPSEHSTQITIPKAIKRRIKMDETIVLSDFAKRMGIKSNELIAKLMGMGMMVTVNQTIDLDTAVLLAAEFQFEVERASFEEEAIIKTEIDSPEQLIFRPPVVTIMGHVDHGKTSLLDAIRHSKITSREAGGITQHIGAYHVTLDRGEIVFLDTPGHEAFTAMRARGAQVTDIVILVVAADDGVMPQTIEAINHSKSAGVPIIVAVNKIDKPDAEPERVKRELAEKGLAAEDWGGDAIFVNVSAKAKTGINELLDMIILQAELLELKANPDKHARGYIIESRMDTGRGPVATVLITEGTLHAGEAVVSGMHHGKIRAMFDDRGEPVDKATPSLPVEIIGLSGVPLAGDEFIAVAEEKDAKQVSAHRIQKQRSLELAKTSRLSLDKLYEQLQEGVVKDLNLVIKADVQGSIEALRDSLTRLTTDEVKVNIVHEATGTIHESDISLAAVSNAIIIGFNVRPSGKVARQAEEENVDIRYYNVIYNTIKEVKNAMVGLMDSRYDEKVLGRAEVRQVFTVPNIGAIAGSYVMDGKIQRGQPIRLLRDGVIVFEGKIDSLRRFKDDVKEVAQNYECGIGIANFNDIKTGDVIECFYLVEVKPVYE